MLEGDEEKYYSVKLTPLSQGAKEGKRLKIITPKKLLTKLPILLAQTKAGNNSKKLRNAIRQIVYPLYQYNNISKDVYSNLIKLL